MRCARRKLERVEHDRILGDRAQLRRSRIAFAWPVRAERNRPWWSAVVSRPSATLRSSGRAATAPKTCIPLHSSSRCSDQTGSSCRQSTSGRSSVARRTICSRKPCRSGGLALPWKTFQVRTSRLTGRASLGRVLAPEPLRRGGLAAARPLRARQPRAARGLRRGRARLRPGRARRGRGALRRLPGARRGRHRDPRRAARQLRLDARRGPAEEYEAAFNRAVEKRLPRFGLEIEDT